MTTVAIIPARYGSARIPGKPLALIAGKPMIQHVVERTRQAALIDRVLVATDDERIRDTVEAFGGTAVMTSVALQSGSDRIASAAQLLPDASIIVNVQGDEPLIDPRMIDQAIRPLLEDPALPAATLIRAITSQEELLSTSFPKVVIDQDGYCLYFSRSVIPFLRDTDQSGWLGQHTFYRHIGLYVFRREFLLQYAAMAQGPLEHAEKLEQLRILEHGRRIRAIVTDYDSIPVDTPADLAKVRALCEMKP